MFIPLGGRKKKSLVIVDKSPIVVEGSRHWCSRKKNSGAIYIVIKEIVIVEMVMAFEKATWQPWDYEI